MPPRPTDQNVQNLATLIEAFPDVEPQVIQVVLRAAGNNVEQAFNALLGKMQSITAIRCLALTRTTGMSDPNIDTEDAPPPKPPRPSADARQLAEDEAYARRLAQKDQARYARRSQPRQQQQEEEDQGFFSGALEGASGAFEGAPLSAHTRSQKLTADRFHRKRPPRDQEKPGTRLQGDSEQGEFMDHRSSKANRWRRRKRYRCWPRNRWPTPRLRGVPDRPIARHSQDC